MKRGILYAELVLIILAVVSIIFFILITSQLIQYLQSSGSEAVCKLGTLKLKDKEVPNTICPYQYKFYTTYLVSEPEKTFLATKNLKLSESLEELYLADEAVGCQELYGKMIHNEKHSGFLETIWLNDVFNKDAPKEVQNVQEYSACVVCSINIVDVNSQVVQEIYENRSQQKLATKLGVTKTITTQVKPEAQVINLDTLPFEERRLLYIKDKLSQIPIGDFISWGDVDFRKNTVIEFEQVDVPFANPVYSLEQIATFVPDKVVISTLSNSWTPWHRMDYSEFDFSKEKIMSETIAPRQVLGKIQEKTQVQTVDDNQEYVVLYRQYYQRTGYTVKQPLMQSGVNTQSAESLENPWKLSFSGTVLTNVAQLPTLCTAVYNSP